MRYTRGTVKVRSQSRAMAHRPFRVLTCGCAFNVIIEACVTQASVSAMDLRVGLAKILASRISWDKPWKVCYGCLKFLNPLIKGSDIIWRGEWDWDFVRDLKDGPLPYDG